MQALKEGLKGRRIIQNLLMFFLVSGDCRGAYGSIDACKGDGNGGNGSGGVDNGSVIVV